MVQHTVIHRFAGTYGYFFWTLVVVVFVTEVHRVVTEPRRSTKVAALFAPALIFLLSQIYIPETSRYLTNAVAGEQIEKSSRNKAGKRKNKKRRKRPSRRDSQSR
jgi:hypothetical protein